MAAGGGRVRRVAAHGYDVTWVDLVELDGVAAYTYSEELPYDELLEQHAPGALPVSPRISPYLPTSPHISP